MAYHGSEEIGGGGYVSAELQLMMTDECAIADNSRLRSLYPQAGLLDAFVTNVHNVMQLRFFMFVKNAENANHFANVRYAATPPNAYKCLRMPREGFVFALRLGESTMVRAIRLRTMCITTKKEVFLPDIGRNELLKDGDELNMYHLPYNLRQPPGIAVQCQLIGINDDVTILPNNMRKIIRGLLYRNVKLRVDGYAGNMLKVQLMDVAFDQLSKWTTELGEEEMDFSYALKHTILFKAKNVEEAGGGGAASSIVKDAKNNKEQNLPPIAEEDEKKEPKADHDTISLSSLTSSDSWISVSSDDAADVVPPPLSPNGGDHQQQQDEILSIEVEASDDDGVVDDNDVSSAKLSMRPLLGRKIVSFRPILGAGGGSGGSNTSLADNNSWKCDVLPALVTIDNRQIAMSYYRDELIDITPTCISQLERFFGIIHNHRRDPHGIVHLQHVWSDEEIPWSSHYTEENQPYIFDVVLAKHGGDFKWYRAKVIEIFKEQCKVRVFYVDYGGAEYVDIWNVANLTTAIAKLPFQAVMFRICDIMDTTTSKAERQYGIEFLRSMLLKKRMTVRVVSCRSPEISICFEKQNSNITTALIQKGLMKPYGIMVK